jgi:2-polyprenyl-6-methoxyphenol hydroxylase-like FAD-dependent oxidoreductase
VVLVRILEIPGQISASDRARQSPTESARDVIVVGAGIAGLSAALALGTRGFRVTLLERDQEPKPGAPDWQRPGVPQAVQPHFFMGRLRKLYAESHPGLLERMSAAGVEERHFIDYLHPLARKRYRPRPGDATLVALAARRTLLERLVREYVESEGLATVVAAANVTRLILGGGEFPIRVRGVEAKVGGVVRRLEAGVVIDASGRAGRLHSMLAEAGVLFREEQHDCQLRYFTRWYSLREGQAYPATAGLPGQIFADFVAGALPADNGQFTVTLQVHAGDAEMIALARDPNRFQSFCEQLPAIAAWISPRCSKPLGRIHGFGAMDAFWRSMVIDGKPQAAGIFLLGDTAIRSNPRFGRGCTWAAVGAHLLADVLNQTNDPAERVLRYEDALEAEYRADWRTMLAADRAARRQFEIAAGLRRATVRDRITAIVDAGLNKAMIADPEVFRAVWTGYHGLAQMAAWARRPEIWARIVRVMLLGAGELSPVVRRLRARPDREMLRRKSERRELNR